MPPTGRHSQNIRSGSQLIRSKSQLFRSSTAPVAFQSDAQISSRFTPFEIPLWTESEDFRRLLSSFEQALPLRRSSQLTQRPVVQFLVAASGGLLGEVSRMLNTAAELAILDGSERITLEMLEQVAHAHA